MYGVYNVETLEKLITTVHNIHNTTSSHERLFAGQHSPSIFRMLYAHLLGLHHYSINSLLYLRTIQDKYITLLLCNIRKTIKWIIVRNRVRDNCNLLYIFSSFILSCFFVFVYTFVENNHDCLGVMQFLYYKSLSKHILKSEEIELGYRN